MSGKTAKLPRNWEIASGLMRFSQARMYQRRRVWKRKSYVTKPKPKPQAEKYKIKKIGGKKNNGERKVLINKPAKLLPQERVGGKRKRNPAKKVPLRKSITPGTVLIILAGRHRGKRVVFLKQLEKTGLLLVTGPHKLNSVPLRRIAQAFVIATKTKIDISGVKVPENLNDAYFKRQKQRKIDRKPQNTDIFAKGKTEYKVSEQRKKDQKAVDAGVLAAVKKHADKKLLLGYLGSRFQLRNEHPHQIIF